MTEPTGRAPRESNTDDVGFRRRVLLVIVLIFGGAWVYSSFAEPTGTGRPKLVDHPSTGTLQQPEVATFNEGDAIAACQTAVQKTLRDPGSVEWIDRQEWPVRHDLTSPVGIETYTVTLTYRAENEVGAPSVERSKCIAAGESDDKTSWTASVAPLE